MPKAKPYPDVGGDSADESTNIASPWEDDEASTTIEPGDAGRKKLTDKPNGKHLSSYTNTGTGTGIDEPTVDDQHAPALSAITPIRPDLDARLLITGGNDAGQVIEIRPGKTYTIGRGLDNDVVLTDIAVSRKHFDLKLEDGAWIIVDRGSGNGTIVNGNIEDNPFMLASGDSIEIGNTTFKFDQPSGAPRVSQRTYDLEDEEMSTVAGKPLLRDSIPSIPTPPPPSARPKTMPPPLPPMRPANASVPPPLAPASLGGFPPRNEPGRTEPPFPRSPGSPFGNQEPQTPFSQPPGPFSQPPPLSSTLPVSPIPSLANRGPMAAGPRSPTMLGDAVGLPAHLQPDSAASMPMAQGMSPYGYPQANEMPPHQQMLLVQSQGRRADGSTALVQPVPYDPRMQRYRTPGMARRTKLIAAGLGLALLTGIVTAAALKSSKDKPAASAKKNTGSSTKATDKKGQAIVSTPIETKPNADAPRVADAQKVTDAQKVADPQKAAEAQRLIDAQKAAEAVRAADAKKAAEDAAKKQADDAARADAAAKRAEQEAAAKQAAEEKRQAQQAAREEAARKAEEARQARADAKRAAAEKRRDRTTTTAAPTEKRVAVATDSSGARDKADALYRDGKFNDAAKLLAAAAKSGGNDAAELRDRSNKLRALGAAYAKGMAPAEKPATAFAALTQAINLDGSVGGNFKSELNDKLAAIAPKAAVAFIAQKDYGSARSAYLAAQRAGSNDSNLTLVKQKLESVANDLYAAASAEASSSPTSAKDKLRQIRTLVDAKSPIAVKAQALYNKL